MYQVSDSDRAAARSPPAASRRDARARASTAPSSCSGSPACSPTSPRRWSSRSCRSTWSSSAGFSPLAFGVIDGIYNGATALVRLASGFSATGCSATRRSRRPATASRRSASSPWCSSARRCRRSARSCCSTATGKGIRTAPRDAMISLSTPKEQLGTAFGVHRAMDTDRRDDRPAAGLRAARARAARLRLGLPRLASASRSSGSRSSCCSSTAARARPGAQAPERERRRCAAPFALLELPRFRAAARRRRRAQPRDGQRRVHLPRAPGGARPRHVAVPAAVRRQRRHLHACSPSRWAGSPTGSAAAAVLLGGYVLLLATSSRRSCCPVGGWLAADRHRSACSAPTTPRPTAS